MRTVLVAVLVLALGVGGAAAVDRSPSLHVTSLRPFTVAGRDFRPNEVITLTVWTDSGATRRVTATRAGTFLARFPGLHVDPCAGYAVRAVGSLGSRASLARRLAECPTPVIP